MINWILVAAISVGLLIALVTTVILVSKLFDKKTLPLTNQIQELISKSNEEKVLKIDNSVESSQIISQLSSEIKLLPNQVLQSITGSANAQKGKLGELVGYITLKADYDRIIPIGNIVDVVAIKFPEGDDPGRIDFIDIKTGKNARLSTDQRKLKTVLDEKEIYFRTIKIDDVETK